MDPFIPSPTAVVQKSLRAPRAMIATGNPLAAQAAGAMLDRGGSAVDAAIAADAVMGVVEPMATSIGGDVLAMVHEASGEVISYNGTGRAPAAMDADFVANMPGARIPERHPSSVTTPGAVRGWEDLHQRYGKLRWKQLFEPAIQYARDGFPVAAVSAQEWRLFDHVLHLDPNCAQLYRAGDGPKAGEIFTNSELAGVLASIAQEGADFFDKVMDPRRGRRRRSAYGRNSASDGFPRTHGHLLHAGLHDVLWPSGSPMPAQHARHRHSGCP